MMKYRSLIVALFVLNICFGQKVRVGVVNSDSLLLTIPEYASWLQARNERLMFLESTAYLYQSDYIRKSNELDSLSGLSSPDLVTAKNLELKKIEDDYNSFVARTNDSVHKDDSLHNVPYQARLDRAKFIAAERNKCYGVCEFASVTGRNIPNGITYVNINKDVASELKTASPLGGKKRIGVCNYDSLLKMTPGYQQAVDSSKKYRAQLDAELHIMELHLAKKQHVLDSIGTNESSLITALRQKEIIDLTERIELFKQMAADESKIVDSLIFFDVRKRLDVAIYQASKENKCTITYDNRKAHSMWRDSDAEFVDVNEAIVSKLKL